MKFDLDISFILSDRDFHVKDCVYEACREISSFYDIAGNYSPGRIGDGNCLPRLAEFYRYIMETALLSDDDKRHIPKLMKRFADFGNDRETGILKAASLVGSAIRLRENRQYKECIAEIKRAIAAYEPLAAVLSEYSRLVLNEYEKAAKAAQSQNEMQVLAAAIKRNIRAYIAAGDLAAARKTLEQYRLVAPDDREIEIISDEIDRRN